MTKVAIALISIFILAGVAIYFLGLNSKAPTPRPTAAPVDLQEYSRSKSDLKTVGYVFDRQMSHEHLLKLRGKLDGIPGVVKVYRLESQMAIEVTYDPIGVSEEELTTQVTKSIESSATVTTYHVNMKKNNRQAAKLY